MYISPLTFIVAYCYWWTFEFSFSPVFLVKSPLCMLTCYFLFLKLCCLVTWTLSSAVVSFSLEWRQIRNCRKWNNDGSMGNGHPLCQFSPFNLFFFSFPFPTFPSYFMKDPLQRREWCECTTLLQAVWKNFCFRVQRIF